MPFKKGNTLGSKNYKGGGVDSLGYHRQTRLGKRNRSHRLMLEGKLGRKLKTDEIVHHLNENKLDNRPINLRIVSAKEHHRLHAGWWQNKNGDWWKICPTCKKKLEVEKNFYPRRERTSYRPICKSCTYKAVADRRKRKAV